MTVSTTTNPWTSGSNDTLSLLRERGYKAVETVSGKYSIDLGNGKKVEFEKWEPIWTVLNRIKNAPTETTKESEKDEDIIEKWHRQNLEAAKKATEAGKAAEKEEDKFAQLIYLTKKKLAGVFRPFKKFNVNKGKDLAGVEAKTLVERNELHDAKEDATKYEGDIAKFKKEKLHYNLLTYSEYSTAFTYVT